MKYMYGLMSFACPFAELCLDCAGQVDLFLLGIVLLHGGSLLVNICNNCTPWMMPAIILFFI